MASVLKPTSMEYQIAKCSNPKCPSQMDHNTGYYNFSLSYKDETTRSNKLLQDILDALKAVYANEDTRFPNDNLSPYIFVAEIALAHRSHLQGLMPRTITRSPKWQKAEIKEILESAGPQPVQTSVEPAKANKKAALPQSRLGNAMGRGDIFTGKTGVDIVHPSQKTKFSTSYKAKTA